MRAEADRIELAEKIINDMDKPKAEVVVDLMVIEASSTFSKQVTAAIASTGLNLPVTFSPRSSIQVQNSATRQPTTNTTQPSQHEHRHHQRHRHERHDSDQPNWGRSRSSDFATTLPSALMQPR